MVNKSNDINELSVTLLDTTFLQDVIPENVEKYQKRSIKTRKLFDVFDDCSIEPTQSIDSTKDLLNEMKHTKSSNPRKFLTNGLKEKIKFRKKNLKKQFILPQNCTRSFVKSNATSSNMESFDYDQGEISKARDSRRKKKLFENQLVQRKKRSKQKIDKYKVKQDVMSDNANVTDITASPQTAIKGASRLFGRAEFSYKKAPIKRAIKTKLFNVVTEESTNLTPDSDTNLSNNATKNLSPLCRTQTLTHHKRQLKAKIKGNHRYTLANNKTSPDSTQNNSTIVNEPVLTLSNLNSKIRHAKTSNFGRNALRRVTGQVTNSRKYVLNEAGENDNKSNISIVSPIAKVVDMHENEQINNADKHNQFPNYRHNRRITAIPVKEKLRYAIADAKTSPDSVNNNSDICKVPVLTPTNLLNSVQHITRKLRKNALRRVTDQATTRKYRVSDAPTNKSSPNIMLPNDDLENSGEKENFDSNCAMTTAGKLNKYPNYRRNRKINATTLFDISCAGLTSESKNSIGDGCVFNDADIKTQPESQLNKRQTLGCPKFKMKVNKKIASRYTIVNAKPSPETAENDSATSERNLVKACRKVYGRATGRMTDYVTMARRYKLSADKNFVASKSSPSFMLSSDSSTITKNLPDNEDQTNPVNADKKFPNRGRKSKIAQQNHLFDIESPNTSESDKNSPEAANKLIVGKTFCVPAPNRIGIQRRMTDQIKRKYKLDVAKSANTSSPDVSSKDWVEQSTLTKRKENLLKPPQFNNYRQRAPKNQKKNFPLSIVDGNDASNNETVEVVHNQTTNSTDINEAINPTTLNHFLKLDARLKDRKSAQPNYQISTEPSQSSLDMELTNLSKISQNSFSTLDEKEMRNNMLQSTLNTIISRRYEKNKELRHFELPSQLLELDMSLDQPSHLENDAHKIEDDNYCSTELKLSPGSNVSRLLPRPATQAKSCIAPPLDATRVINKLPYVPIDEKDDPLQVGKYMIQTNTPPPPPSFQNDFPASSPNQSHPLKPTNWNFPQVPNEFSTSRNKSPKDAQQSRTSETYVIKQTSITLPPESLGNNLRVTQQLPSNGSQKIVSINETSTQQIRRKSSRLSTSLSKVGINSRGVSFDTSKDNSKRSSPPLVPCKRQNSKNAAKDLQELSEKIIEYNNISSSNTVVTGSTVENNNNTVKNVVSNMSADKSNSALMNHDDTAISTKSGDSSKYVKVYGSQVNLDFSFLAKNTWQSSQEKLLKSTFEENHMGSKDATNLSSNLKSRSNVNQKFGYTQDSIALENEKLNVIADEDELEELLNTSQLSPEISVAPVKSNPTPINEPGMPTDLPTSSSNRSINKSKNSISSRYKRPLMGTTRGLKPPRLNSGRPEKRLKFKKVVKQNTHTPPIFHSKLLQFLRRECEGFKLGDKSVMFDMAHQIYEMNIREVNKIKKWFPLTKFDEIEISCLLGGMCNLSSSDPILQRLTDKYLEPKHKKLLYDYMANLNI